MEKNERNLDKNRVTVAHCCFCHVLFHGWQRKSKFSWISRRFRVHDSCQVKKFSPFFSCWSRGLRFSRIMLSTFSVSSPSVDSLNFPVNRVELYNKGFSKGACGILKRATTKHMGFSETEKGKWEWEVWKFSLKIGFWWGFLLNFPEIFLNFSAFRVVGVGE